MPDRGSNAHFWTHGRRSAIIVPVSGGPACQSDEEALSGGGYYVNYRESQSHQREDGKRGKGKHDHIRWKNAVSVISTVSL